VKKRGRPGSEDKKDVKKTDGASPAKRGRGRPKGSTKKKGKTASKVCLWCVIADLQRDMSSIWSCGSWYAGKYSKTCSGIYFSLTFNKIIPILICQLEGLCPSNMSLYFQCSCKMKVW